MKNITLAKPKYEQIGMYAGYYDRLYFKSQFAFCPYDFFSLS